MQFLHILLITTLFLIIPLSNSQLPSVPVPVPVPVGTQNDRDALLRFKAGILQDTTLQLLTWETNDCCDGSWVGVECGRGPTAGRVVKLTVETERDRPLIFMRGLLSPALGNLNFLEELHIIGLKKMVGPIPDTLSTLTRLRVLNLEGNGLTGPIPPSFGRLLHLESLVLQDNQLTGEVPPSLGNLKRLKFLNLFNNFLTGTIPRSLGGLPNLSFLDLSYNVLSGTIPADLARLQNLQNLILSRNQLTGQIPLPLFNLPQITEFSVDQNLLSGRIPPQIANLKSVTVLRLSSNRFIGQIPDSIGRMQNLWSLNLSRNFLTNPVPHAAFNRLSHLIVIDLSYNNLDLGTVPSWITNTQQIDAVHLAGCKLRGPLPNFTDTYSIKSLDLSANYFTTGIENFLGSMPFLEHAVLSYNMLSADLATIRLPNQISVLDLHSNRIFGSVTSLLSNKNLKFMETIDLSNNLISGQIPNSVSNLEYLQRLDVSRNQITGTIPTSLGSLKKLRCLDLSGNRLAGRIPPSLLGITTLSHASFRSNRLCGEIPQGRPFNIFPPAAYSGNLCLCGRPLAPCKGKQIIMTGP